MADHDAGHFLQQRFIPEPQHRLQLHLVIPLPVKDLQLVTSLPHKGLGHPAETAAAEQGLAQGVKAG